MLVLGTTVVGARDVRRATEFWAAALGLTPGKAYGDNDFTNLTAADGRPVLSIQRSEHEAEAEPRLHLDLYARDADDQEREVVRLVALGAVRVPWHLYPGDPDFTVLADTEGNLFCIVDNARAPEQFRLDLQ